MRKFRLLIPSSAVSSSGGGGTSSIRSAMGNPLFVGIAVGVLLGLCLSFMVEVEEQDFLAENVQNELPDAFFSRLPIQLMSKKALAKRYPSPTNGDEAPPLLSCAILLESSDGLKPEKQFTATRDTWARECNETLFFTDSQSLYRKYIEDLSNSTRLYLVQGHSSPSLQEWKFVRNILNFIIANTTESKNAANGQKWTILADGKSYVHTRNLRNLLSTVQPDIPIVLGRKHQQKNSLISFHSFMANLMSFVSSSSSFSSSNWPLSSTISAEGPIIFSSRALHSIGSQLGKMGQAGAAKWWWPFDGNFPSILGGPFPRHTGRAIGGLALRMGIALWDPIDEERRPLIVNQNLRELFTKNVSKTNATEGRHHQPLAANGEGGIGTRMADCCSDQAIAFGMLNHKDQRLIDFGVRQLKVFGTVRS